MPVQEFDGNDSWGYNPCFFFALDKAYGTPKMYKDFIDACHRKGMAVILDVVYNHATGNMPFARLYWDSAKNKTARNNPYFNTDAPHPYSVFQDFNHESPLVRKFVKRNLKFLLDEYKIDGFRFDLTKGFTQTASTEATASNYDAARIAILKDYHSAVKAAKSDALVIFEHFCEKKEEQELATEGIYLWRNMNNAYCQSAMGWKENSGFDGLYESTPSWVGFMESHDEERMGYKQTQWGNGVLQTDLPTRISQLAANAAFFFTVPGPKMIWQFGELGYDFSINSNETGTAVSEEYRTSRKPIRWDYYENATRKELFEIYSQLIDLRNEKPSLFEGNATLEGNLSTVLTTPDKIAISETFARKLFHGHSGIGEMIEIIDADGKTQKYEVGAILKERPQSFLHFDLLTGITGEFWGGPTLLKLHPGASASLLQEKIRKDKIPTLTPGSTQYYVDALKNLYFNTNKNSKQQELPYFQQSDVPLLYIGLISALLVLAIACFNYTNLSLSRTLQQIKMIHIEKLMGAQLKEIGKINDRILIPHAS